METKSKIQKLWRHLRIQDDEILIVQNHNHSTGADEFIVAKQNNGTIEITTEPNLPTLNPDTQPFQFIKQLDASGKHTIPSVEQMIEDERMDY